MCHRKPFLVLLCTIFSLSIASATIPRPSVSVPTVGKVQGHRLSADQSVVEFLGIRYADAPIGELRWAPPRSVSWDSFRADERIICSQPESFLTAPNATITEDCLRLNIWVRDDILEAAKAAGPHDGYVVFPMYCRRNL